MKFSRAALILGFLVPGVSRATCVVEPLEPPLRAAEIVYVGTVVQSKLSLSLESLRDGTRPEVVHKVVPQLILKGDPSAIHTVLSATGYSSPQSRRFPKFAELVQVSPGDSLLVVGSAGQSSRVGLCSASRRWDQQTEKVVLAVFPPAP